jgi:hypothetical protein
MARGKRLEDLTTIQMALVGYQIEKQKIEDKIRELQSQLKGKRVLLPSAAKAKNAPGSKRILSPAARRRISAAQKKRWAEHHRRVAQASKGE